MNLSEHTKKKLEEIVYIGQGAVTIGNGSLLSHNMIGNDIQKIIDMTKEKHPLDIPGSNVVEIEGVKYQCNNPRIPADLFNEFILVKQKRSKLSRAKRDIVEARFFQYYSIYEPSPQMRFDLE